VPSGGIRLWQDGWHSGDAVDLTREVSGTDWQPVLLIKTFCVYLTLSKQNTSPDNTTSWDFISVVISAPVRDCVVCMALHFHIRGTGLRWPNLYHRQDREASVFKGKSQGTADAAEVWYGGQLDPEIHVLTPIKLQRWKVSMVHGFCLLLYYSFSECVHSCVIEVNYKEETLVEFELQHTMWSTTSLQPHIENLIQVYFKIAIKSRRFRLPPRCSWGLRSCCC
jgi:hypothetical protein